MSEPLSLMIGFPKSGGIIFELVLSLGLLWFLYALFFCSVVFYLLVKHTNKSLPVMLSVVGGLLILAFCLTQFVGIYLPFSAGSYPVIIAIMIVAAYLRQSNFLNKEIKTKKDFIVTGINMIVAEGIIVGICLFCHYQFGAMVTGTLLGGQFDGALKGFDCLIGFAFGILGTYFLHNACRLIGKIPVLGKTLGWVGAHSALFYLFHPIFLDLTAIVIFQKKIIWGHNQAYFYVLIVVILLSLAAFLIDLITKKIKEKKQPQELEVSESK